MHDLASITLNECQDLIERRTGGGNISNDLRILIKGANTLDPSWKTLLLTYDLVGMRLLSEGYLVFSKVGELSVLDFVERLTEPLKWQTSRNIQTTPDQTNTEAEIRQENSDS